VVGYSAKEAAASATDSSSEAVTGNKEEPTTLTTTLVVGSLVGLVQHCRLCVGVIAVMQVGVAEQ
jgi:hypothetical protein